MGDNGIDMPEDQKVNVQTVKTDRRVRIGFVFLSVVPVAVLMAIQTLAQIPFLIMAMVDVLSGTDSYASDIDYLDMIITVFSEKYATYMYLIYVVIGIAVFFFWYYKGFVKKRPKVRLKEIFGTRSVIAIIGTALGLYFFINAVLTLISWISPQTIDFYNQLIESAGIVSDSVMTVFYTIILGPVAEELCFRGVVFGFLEKSGIKPAWIIVISSIMFGVMHLIPIQVMYAAVIALFLGFLRYRYRSVILTAVTHILFNFCGTFLSETINTLGLSEGVLMIFGGVSAVLLVFIILLVNGDKKAFKPVSNS